jgi:hypothetical protein
MVTTHSNETELRTFPIAGREEDLPGTLPAPETPDVVRSRQVAIRLAG